MPMKKIRPIFVYFNVVTEKFIVQQSLCIEWKEKDTAWQDDKDIGKHAFVPDIDIEDGKEIFDTADQALYRMAELYSEQYLECKESEKNFKNSVDSKDNL